MQVKVFSAWSEASLERKVNGFIANPTILVKEIQFNASFGVMYAMIIYDFKNHE